MQQGPPGAIREVWLTVVINASEARRQRRATVHTAACYSDAAEAESLFRGYWGRNGEDVAIPWRPVPSSLVQCLDGPVAKIDFVWRNTPWAVSNYWETLDFLRPLPPLSPLLPVLEEAPFFKSKTCMPSPTPSIQARY